MRARIDAAVLPCREADPELFFPVRSSTSTADEQKFQAKVSAAKATCGSCPVLAECLEWALTTGQRDGIWGAKTPEERVNLRRRRAAQRRRQAVAS
ncbi:MAG TPA: WhiB family transcriptional regulator [Mycobacteriales bacterium]